MFRNEEAPNLLWVFGDLGWAECAVDENLRIGCLAVAQVVCVDAAVLGVVVD